MNAYDLLRERLAELATPLRDPEPLREVVDAMLWLLSRDFEAKMRLRRNLTATLDQLPSRKRARERERNIEPPEGFAADESEAYPGQQKWKREE